MGDLVAYTGVALGVCVLALAFVCWLIGGLVKLCKRFWRAINED